MGTGLSDVGSHVGHVWASALRIMTSFEMCLMPPGLWSSVHPGPYLFWSAESVCWAHTGF